MIIYNSKEFGALLKAKRKELKYTQKDVSKILGLSVGFISELENGKKTAELEKAIKYAVFLGFNLELSD
ncbi:MAG: helix-turn-helix domain-containing protein [Lachnospiraceae bacterium]|nr:helix-turn-helix domain-containing protein [Lachnospiraceae bacterium]